MTDTRVGSSALLASLFSIFMNYEEQLKHPKWQKKRLEIMNRAGWKCEKCERDDETLHVHHISYDHGGPQPWNYHDSWLQCLCETCHTLSHIDEKRIIKFLGERAPEIRYVNKDDDAIKRVDNEIAKPDWTPEELKKLLKWRSSLVRWKLSMPSFDSANVLDEPHGCLARSLRSRIRDKHPCWL